MSNLQGDFILAEGENFQQCPYNLAHVITNARIVTHLDKCRRAYIKAAKAAGQSVIMKECKFNWIHQVPLPEIDYHELRCQDQYRVVEAVAYHQSAQFKVKLEEDELRKKEDQLPEKEPAWMEHSSHSKKKHSKKHKDVKPDVSGIWGEDTEDWEADSNGYATGYDPAYKLENSVGFILNPRGLSKSERKVYRREQKIKAEDHDHFQRMEESKDVKPVVGKDEIETQESSAKNAKAKAPAPIIKPEPVQWRVDTEVEEGECSGEEFFGEDPYG